MVLPPPLLNIHLQPLLNNKECRKGLEVAVGMNELEAVVAQQPRHDLVDLEQREVAADAEVGSAAELCS